MFLALRFREPLNVLYAISTVLSFPYFSSIDFISPNFINPSELYEIIMNFASSALIIFSIEFNALFFLLNIERFQFAGIPETLLSFASGILFCAIMFSMK